MTDSNRHPRRIVIAGGGTAGWMAAAAIARTMGRTVDLTLVESEAIGTIGVGESTIPPLVNYNRVLGINEADFMRATQATFKLGILFDNWKNVGDRYFHSFGLTGKDHWSAGFQHFWMHGRRQLQPGALPPGGRAGNQRKRDCQNKDMAQNMTHAAMLTGRTGSRQRTLPERVIRHGLRHAESIHCGFPALVVRGSKCFALRP